MAAETFPQTGAVTFRDARGLEHEPPWQAAKRRFRGFTPLGEFPALCIIRAPPLDVSRADESVLSCEMQRTACASICSD